MGGHVHRFGHVAQIPVLLEAVHLRAVEPALGEGFERVVTVVQGRVHYEVLVHDSSPSSTHQPSGDSGTR